MARKPNDYWEERNTEMMKLYEKKTEKYIAKLIKAYNRAFENIDKEIKNIFRNYAKDGVLSDDALKFMLNKKQSDLYRESLLEAIRTLEDSDIKKRLIAKYNAPAYAYRISRYEQLRTNIDIELKKLADIEKKVTTEHYKNIIDDGYNRTMYEIQKGTEIGFNFTQIDTKTVNLILAENWSGSNYSSRIWKNSEKLTQYLSDNMLGDYLSGKSIVKMSKELADAMNVGLFQATRLIRTETNHFANESEMLAYEELDIEEYRYIATLDKITCKHCGKLDNKVFKVKERKEGINYPPMHPHDRCATIAIIDDEVIDNLKRIARDPVTGKNYYVDKNISYEDWKKQIDEKYGKGTLDLEHKKYTNLKKDEEQYKRYKSVLGKENLPRTFEKWQELKYNNANDYNIMKSYYRSTTKGEFPQDMTYKIFKNNINGVEWQAVGFNPQKLSKHYDKHNHDFNYINAKEYEMFAKQFINERHKNKYETFINKNGFVFVYDTKNNIFADAKPNGVTETYFKPKDGYKYWKEQKEIYGQ